MVKSKNHPNNRTRERILDKAEALFACKGYHAVSIREITKSAECNVSAVNYYFGNKQNLYCEVFQYRWLPRAKRIHNCFRQLLADKPNCKPNDIVRALAQAFLQGPLTDAERVRHHQLISGEIAQPSQAFNLIAKQALHPLFNSIRGDLNAAMSEIFGDDQLTLSIFSIFAMILHFNFARHLITSLSGHQYDTDFKNRLVDHIVEFSMFGLIGKNGEDWNASTT
ncbi:MAG: TetR/AcrR family transcriptional regulator [Desulfobacterales bacterium]|nr:TetR/AcrR family transcriptional regulator [Desulfobacterales bacterium]